MRLQAAGAFFVVRAKSNLLWRRRYSRPVDKQLDLRCDQTIVLSGPQTVAKYPQPLRRVGYRDSDQQRTFHFLTNNFEVPARTVADLYRHRWRVELLFEELSGRICMHCGMPGEYRDREWVRTECDACSEITDKIGRRRS